MSGEGSEQRSGPAEAILARRSSRPEMPGWLLKEGADEEDESGSEYDPAEELPKVYPAQYPPPALCEQAIVVQSCSQ